MSSPRLFIARRSIAPPAPLPDILTPILASFVAVVFGAITYIVLPPQPTYVANYQITTYEYHPPEPNFTAITIHTANSINGHITKNSVTHTFKKPAEEIDCTISKCLALTFDDGPSEHTDRLLDILKNSDTRASFFPLGHRVWAFSGQIARMAEEGHDVGSHSWIHRNLPRFSFATILDDLSGTTNVVQSVTDKPVRFFRPPYGNTNHNVNNIITDLNQQTVLWSIDPWDWQNKDAIYICDHVASHAHPGGVVLLHDIYDTSVDATQCIIDRLSYDYAFVNLSTLYK